MPARDRRSRERGGALLVALGLLALGAALLAGSAQSGRAAWRAAHSQVASVTADAEARAALGRIVRGWGGDYDSIAVGQSREVSVGARVVGAGGLVASTRLRVLRVSTTRYVVGIEVTVGPAGVVVARRRICVIMQREPPADTSSVSPAPRPIARWGVADLF
jgi:hypothetical protein